MPQENDNPKYGEKWRHYGTGKTEIILQPNVQMKDGGTRWVEAVAYYTEGHPEQTYVRSLLSFLKAFEKVVE